MRHGVRALAILTAVAALCRPAAAHEFWIEPSSWQPPAGARVAFDLRVGDGFPGESYPRNPHHIRRFDVTGPAGVSRIEGSAGADPAGSAQVAVPGIHVAAYRSHPSSIELAAEVFEAYLAEEGLEHVSKLRADRGDGARPGRERYSRSAKTLIRVEGGDDTGFDRVVGLDLELVPEASPFGLAPGDRLPVRALLDGKPLQGLLLRAFRKGHANPPAGSRTDGEGRCLVRIDADGTWMISGVHMRPATEDAGADWESIWASLTFAVRRPAPSRLLERDAADDSEIRLARHDHDAGLSSDGVRRGR